MASRELLHASKLNDFGKWIEEQGYMILPTSKNPYEVLRAKKDKDTVIIYQKNDSKEHLSVMDKDYSLIRRFINESKKQTNENRERKEKPIDVFKGKEQLEECLREWKHILYLDGWMILAHVEDKIMNPNGEEEIDAVGYNTFIFESSQANIQLLSDETYKENNTLFKHCMEKDLVHELLHCKYDWMGCQGGTYEGVYLDATEHQKLEEMAKSLIMAKYGVGYDYFM